LIPHLQWVEETLLKRYQKLTNTQTEQKDHHIKKFLDFGKTWMTGLTYSKEDNNLWALDEMEYEVVKQQDPDFLKSSSKIRTKRHFEKECKR